MAQSLENASLIIGADVLLSENLELIALILGFLEYQCGIKVYVIPQGKQYG